MTGPGDGVPATGDRGRLRASRAAYVLKGSQIDVPVAVLGTGTQVTLAVTGGTGAYAGVTGWARAVDADRTFYLIRPGQN
jgi:hypothetical protein